MSYKAYVFRLRTEQDVDDLDTYINKSDMDDIAFLEFFYIPKKSFQRFKVKDTDLVAAITVDCGDLAESLRDEGGIERRHYFCRLDDLPKYSRKREVQKYGKEKGMGMMGTSVVGWDEAPQPNPEGFQGWAEWAKDYLDKKGCHEYTTKGGIWFEYGFIAKPSDMYGKLEPFRPCWNISTYDGTGAFFDTKRECIEWADEWDEITK
jgi:hypothetical protein